MSVPDMFDVLCARLDQEQPDAYSSKQKAVIQSFITRCRKFLKDCPPVSVTYDYGIGLVLRDHTTFPIVVTDPNQMKDESVPITGNLPDYTQWGPAKQLDISLAITGSNLGRN